MPTSFEREATTPDPSKSSVGPGLRRLPARYTGQCPARAWTWGLLSSSRTRGRRGVEESVGFRLCMQGCARPQRLGKNRFVVKASQVFNHGIPQLSLRAKPLFNRIKVDQFDLVGRNFQCRLRPCSPKATRLQTLHSKLPKPPNSTLSKTPNLPTPTFRAL